MNACTPQVFCIPRYMGAYPGTQRYPNFRNAADVQRGHL
jgi:hypothetical protein